MGLKSGKYVKTADEIMEEGENEEDNRHRATSLRKTYDHALLNNTLWARKEKNTE